MHAPKPLLTRWTGAVAGFAIGAADTVLLRLLGAELALWIGAYFTASFVMLGFLLGWALESRARERVAGARLELQARRLAEAQVRVAHADKLATLGQLASTMAHELRNPLAIIRSTVQNLQETLEPGDSEAHRTCRFVLDEIDRLTRVTSSIVRFARPLTLARAPIGAGELLDRCAALSERMLSTRAVGLATRIEGESAVLDLDADLICQAVLGLVDNAARFSPDGASVQLLLDARGDELRLCVDDSGPGVAAELHDKLFEPFFTTRDDGAGLGLPIVQQIVRAHGGTVVVGDRPGGGARFEVRLPKAAGQELAA